jgi:nitrogen fixation-related uncharacterized protein
METFWTIFVMLFVAGIGALGVYALFELTRWAHHSDQFRDPVTGRRRGESPHLE